MANTVDKVINIAMAEVGYLEKKSDSQLYDKTANAGRNNYTKFNKEMHDIYPSVMNYPAAWCDAFCDWCFQKAYGVSNAKGLLGGNFNDYTPSSAQLYKNKGAWYTSNPKVGDQIFFKNNVRICHTGLVYKVDKNYVYTIEGNTSGASGVIANGGGVCKKKYSLKYSRIAGYGRPKYDVVDSNSTNLSVDKTKVTYITHRIPNNKWGSEITGYNLVDSMGYSGSFGKEIDKIAIKLSEGSITYCAHRLNGNWGSEITGYSTTDTNKYAGSTNKSIDAIAIKASGINGKLKYRVHRTDGKWGGWITGYSKTNTNNYAGSFGKPIDAIQIGIE